MTLLYFFSFFLLFFLLLFFVYSTYKAKKELSRSQNELLQLKNILYTAPHGYYFEYLENNAVYSYCSDKLRLLLNITDKNSSFENLIKNINSSKYQSVLKAFYDLRANEKPFDEEITNDTTNMHFSLNGRIIYSQVSNQKLFVVWFNNHSFEHQLLLKEKQENISLFEKIEVFKNVLDKLPFPIEIHNQNYRFLNLFYQNNVENLGNFHWNELSIPVLQNKSALLKYGQDKTTEEGLQMLLKEASSTYKHLLKELPFGVALFNAQAKLQFFNSKFAQIWMLDASFLKKEPSFEYILDKIQEKNMLPQIKDFSIYKKSAIETFSKLTNSYEEFLYLSGNKIIKQTMLVAPQGGILILTEQK